MEALVVARLLKLLNGLSLSHIGAQYQVLLQVPIHAERRRLLATVNSMPDGEHSISPCKYKNWGCLSPGGLSFALKSDFAITVRQRKIQEPRRFKHPQPRPVRHKCRHTQNSDHNSLQQQIGRTCISKKCTPYTGPAGLSMRTTSTHPYQARKQAVAVYPSIHTPGEGGACLCITTP